jgi:hypothetical protein
MEATMADKLSKISVHYQTGTGNHRCGTCSMFRLPAGNMLREPGSCTLVAGKILSEDVCNRWNAKKKP